MALQGPLGFYSFLAEVRPLRSRCQVRCSTLLLSNPPYFAPYPSLPLVSIMVTTLGSTGWSKVRQCLRVNATQGPIVMVILCSCSDFVTNS